MDMADNFTYSEVKVHLRYLDAHIKELQEQRRTFAKFCIHDEIERGDEHYYCVACGAHVGDIDGLWGPNVDHIGFPYIKDDDPRIVNREQPSC